MEIALNFRIAAVKDSAGHNLCLEAEAFDKTAGTTSHDIEFRCISRYFSEWMRPEIGIAINGLGSHQVREIFNRICGQHGMMLVVYETSEGEPTFESKKNKAAEKVSVAEKEENAAWCVILDRMGGPVGVGYDMSTKKDPNYSTLEHTRKDRARTMAVQNALVSIGGASFYDALNTPYNRDRLVEILEMHHGWRVVSMTTCILDATRN